MPVVAASRPNVTNARTGGLLALSAVCLIPGELAHPQPPPTAAAMFQLIATSAHWSIIHFVQIVGVLIFALGLVGTTALIDHAGRLWVRTVVVIGPVPSLLRVVSWARHLGEVRSVFHRHRIAETQAKGTFPACSCR